jgi:hypothetical protein
MTQKEAGPRDLPVMQKETVERLMRLANIYAWDYHNNSLDNSDADKANLKAALETALRDLGEQSVIVPEPPHECKTESEKVAFAFGWWKALEMVRLGTSGLLDHDNAGTSGQHNQGLI